jgi:glycosyltransferase involved in cell wall biosynthesis
LYEFIGARTSIGIHFKTIETELTRVLQLTNRVPFPPTDGGAIGIYNITKGLSENGCKIDLLSINTPKHSQPAGAMIEYARQFDVFVNTNISKTALLKNLFFSSIPYNVERFISDDVSNTLKDLIANNTYDFIQIEGGFVVYYIDTIRQLSNVPILVRTHNIEYVIWERLALNESNIVKKWFFGILAKRLKKFEKAFYNKADAIAAITTEDQRRLIEMGVNVPIKVIPAGVELKKYNYSETAVCEENTVFSISALDWMPNIEGLEWFLKYVWPEVLKHNPNCMFHVAGKSTPERLMNIKIPNVVFHGFVDDAEAFKQKYQLMIVPLLSGGGMRIKIIEGMAAKKCILSTRIGAEGIICQNNKDIVLADTAEEWIDAILQLLSNPNKIEQISSDALQSVSNNYDNLSITKKYLEFFEVIRSNNSNSN